MMKHPEYAGWPVDAKGAGTGAYAMHRTSESFVATLPGVSAPTLAMWESLMRHAVDAEGRQQTGLARAGYERALSVALSLLDAPPAGRVEDCLAALVVSHHNLADLLVAQGHIDAAARHLCLAHERLIAVHLQAARPVSMRHAALHHSRETHVALLRHLARHGPHAPVTDTLEAASLALHAGGTARH
jgi:hypothetical protein